jgi:hypothetical protein
MGYPSLAEARPSPNSVDWSVSAEMRLNQPHISVEFIHVRRRSGPLGGQKFLNSLAQKFAVDRAALRRIPLPHGLEDGASVSSANSRASLYICRSFSSARGDLNPRFQLVISVGILAAWTRRSMIEGATCKAHTKPFAGQACLDSADQGPDALRRPGQAESSVRHGPRTARSPAAPKIL